MPYFNIITNTAKPKHAYRLSPRHLEIRAINHYMSALTTKDRAQYFVFQNADPTLHRPLVELAPIL